LEKVDEIFGVTLEGPAKLWKGALWKRSVGTFADNDLQMPQ